MTEIVSAKDGHTEAALAAAHAKLGHALPADYLACRRKHDGVTLARCHVPGLPAPPSTILALAEPRRSLR